MVKKPVGDIAMILLEVIALLQEKTFLTNNKLTLKLLLFIKFKSFGYLNSDYF